MARYAEASDLYNHGLPRGLLVEERRLITDVDTTNDRMELAEHGLAADQEVYLVADEDGTLPSPLASATTYYALPVSGSESLFQLATTAGGAAVNLTTEGTGTFGLAVPIAGVINASLDYVTRRIDRKLIAHQVQLTAPYPVEIVGICAKLAAEELLSRLGRSSETISAAAARAIGELNEFVRGVPLRDSAATASANSAVSWGVDLRGWDLDDDGRIL